jgi:hypothetical protein
VLLGPSRGALVREGLVDDTLDIVLGGAIDALFTVREAMGESDARRRAFMRIRVGEVLVSEVEDGRIVCAVTESRWEEVSNASEGRETISKSQQRPGRQGQVHASVIMFEISRGWTDKPRERRRRPCCTW